MHEIPSNADSANVIFLFAKTHGNKKCKALRIAGFLFENSWKEVRGTFKNSFQKIGCDASRCVVSQSPQYRKYWRIFVPAIARSHLIFLYQSNFRGGLTKVLPPFV